MATGTAVNYSLRDGRFIIENYNSAKPFASFFPGIAGPDGIPMWVFYVNRCQCICSMGVEEKEKPIMEFLSANRAYQLTSNQCFRTFLKIRSGKKDIFYEPFQDQLAGRAFEKKQIMEISPASLRLIEENKSLSLKFTVEYFNICSDDFPGLVRTLTIENTGRQKINMEVIDGLPLIIPYGVDNYNLKHMRRLVESFVEVVNLEKNVPYFKIRVKQEDKPEVTPVTAGNFYTGFLASREKNSSVQTIVDPQWIFGKLTDYSYPQAFLDKTPFSINGEQMTENRLPCAMGAFSATIAKGENFTYNSIIGHTHSLESLNKIAKRAGNINYIARKKKKNDDLIEKLTQLSFVQSSSTAFDFYCRQNFLDNVLRGGLPFSFNREEKAATIHLYSRKHGDLERDYNDYRLSPTNYSQGNGNFRDVNQNRRNDLFFNPDVCQSNVEHFYNLLQLDGFNPLVVKTTSFSINDNNKLNAILKNAFGAKNAKLVRPLFKDKFEPGQLMSFLTEKEIKLGVDKDKFVGQLLAISQKHQQADCGHGFWSDHWTYNLDLLENYLAIYPEMLDEILFRKKDFTFFDNPLRVVPREDKYVLWEGRPMQIGAVVHDDEKADAIKNRTGDKHAVRTKFGKGEIYRTTLLHKLLNLIVNKLASLDPAGMGIEMESDKPNWYDALNGLPGQHGSSLSETLELKRHIIFLLQSLERKNMGSFAIAAETYDFVWKIKKILGQSKNDFEYWDDTNTAKEEYRGHTRTGISGKEATIRIAELRDFLTAALDKTNKAISKAVKLNKNGVLPTYFINEVISHKPIMLSKKQVKTNNRGMTCYKALKFKSVPLPLFLEGPVHYLRIEQDKEKCFRLAEAVRSSGLFDKKLKMYKVNESLADQPMEIGRTRVFSRGWLENESIWMHMEYKYMLELLRRGLYDEFFKDFKNVFVPFMDPQIYGRSILENSSFIASSANPDPDVHGTGFVARLSGSTAEFVHILLLMCAGQKPFTMDDKKHLRLALDPVLPAWLFTKEKQHRKIWIHNKLTEKQFAADTFSFMFMGSILVTYHNPLRRDTFGKKAVRPVRAKILDINGKVLNIEGGVFSDEIAEKARSRRIQSIEIELG